MSKFDLLYLRFKFHCLSGSEKSSVLLDEASNNYVRLSENNRSKDEIF